MLEFIVFTFQSVKDAKVWGWGQEKLRRNFREDNESSFMKVKNEE